MQLATTPRPATLSAVLCTLPAQTEMPAHIPLTPAVRLFAASVLGVGLMLAGCAGRPSAALPPTFVATGAFGERTRVLALAPGVIATIVAPTNFDAKQPVELILYALPNGNTTAETMGRRMEPGPEGRPGWRYDIQHIGAQTRALRARGLRQAVVVYLEADTKSWPEWRRVRGYDVANKRIVEMVDELRAAIGSPAQLAVTLTGHSGGGSFMWGFLDGQVALPSWLERIAFLDGNYSFENRHAEQFTTWLRQDRRRTLVVLAYDDREIMLDGKKVVSDSGGTFRATQRMIEQLKHSFEFERDTLGEFDRYRAPQVAMLVHPNPGNRILHTLMIGEMNGYMHALLVRRPEYERGEHVLRPVRAYASWVE